MIFLKIGTDNDSQMFFKGVHRMYIRFSIIISVVLLILSSNTLQAGSMVYTVKAGVNLRSGPSMQYKINHVLNHNQTLIKENQKNNWLEVKTLTGKEGFIHHKMISDTWIKIYKDKRILFLMKGKEVVKKYKIALCPFNPDKDKIKQGDGGTPEGRFYICEMLKDPKVPLSNHFYSSHYSSFVNDSK